MRRETREALLTFELKPAKRERVPLLIGLSGGTGSGKTLTALLMAKGMSDGQRFAVIDTESRRALAYADSFQFDHGELAAPFTPKAYMDAIAKVDSGGYPVIVVDSMSHEYAGDGGILDMQEAEFAKMNHEERNKMRSWIRPKMEHKRMMSRLLQIRAHLILCFRAEPKIEMAKENGKTVIREKRGYTGLDGWFPVCEKSLPYELTAYFLLLAGEPGVPRPIKLMEQHRGFFPKGKAIDEACGRELATWAAGGEAVKGSAGTGGENYGPEEADLLEEIRESITESGLVALSPRLRAAPETAKPFLKDAYRQRLNELRGIG